MSDIFVKLLDLIDRGYTFSDIVSELNISHKQLYKLFRNLNQLGIGFDKKYYDSGDIIYLPKKEIDIPQKKNMVNIITDVNSDSFRVLLIADLHAGSEFENIKDWYDLYDYCIINNIHNIIIVGDFLDGINIGRTESKLHDNSLEQIKYATKNYPFDKNILNFIIFGNHDIDSLISYGVDFSTYLRNFRHDIVPIGYGNGVVNVKNDRILLAHPLCIGVSYTHDLTSNYLLVKGHQHTSKCIIGNNGNCSLYVPSLRNLFLTDNHFLPGAVDLTVKFKGGYFDTIYCRQLMVGDKIYNTNTVQFSVSHPKDRRFDLPIRNVENLCKKRTLVK